MEDCWRITRLHAACPQNTRERRHLLGVQTTSCGRAPRSRSSPHTPVILERDIVSCATLIVVWLILIDIPIRSCIIQRDILSCNKSRASECLIINLVFVYAGVFIVRATFQHPKAFTPTPYRPSSRFVRDGCARQFPLLGRGDSEQVHQEV